MMAAASHNPDDRGDWPDLGDLLRPAIEQVRQSAPPPDAVDRALGRARALGRPAPRPPRAVRGLFLTSAVAASLLVGLGLKFGTPFASPLAHEPSPPSTKEVVQPGDDAGTVALSLPVFIRPGAGPLGGPAALEGAGEVVPTALGQVGSSWADWERLQGLRDLADDTPLVEAYLHHPAPAPRLSVPAAWNTRPRSPAPRITDSDGRALALQGVYVQARLDGARSRTVVDLVFHNPHALAVDGAFECPLPEGASPSWVTLFPGSPSDGPRFFASRPAERPRVELPTPEGLVARISPECWGRPRSAAVVPSSAPLAPDRQLAALAQDAAPAANVFRADLGPIPAGKHIRVVVAYEQLLALRGGRLVYTYNAPPIKLHQLCVTLQLDEAADRRAELVPAGARRSSSEGLVTYRRAWQGDEGPQIVFSTEPPQRAVQACCARPDPDGPYYLHARLRPDITAPDRPAPYARHAVFLLDASPDSGPRFARRARLLLKVLEADPDLQHFNVLVCSTTPAWLTPGGWLPNTRAGRAKALARLEGLIREGATDLGAAFDRLARPDLPAPRGTPVHAFFLSDGRPAWGEARPPHLAARAARSPWALRWHCFASGQGDNAELFAALTRSGGGTYRCASDDDLPAASAAHRQPGLAVREVRFVDGPDARDVLVEGGRPLIYPGGDLVLAARFDRPGPAQIEVTGELAGRPVVQRFPVEITEGGPLATRAWGELAVEELLASHGPDAEALATQLARSLGLVNRLTRFAFLSETPRGPRPLPAQARIADRLRGAWEAAARPASPDDRRAELKAATERWLGPTATRRQLLHVLALIDDAELAPPRPRLPPSLPLRRAAAPAYLAGLREDAGDPGLYLDEAARRARAGQAADAVRCLTGLLVEHPDRDDLAQAVAYRLVAMGRPADAVALLQARVETAGGHDPANHRALSLALSRADRPGLAILHAEAALALLGHRGSWHAAAREELAALLRAALACPCLPGPLRAHCRSRLAEIGTLSPADLTATLTWSAVGARLELTVITAGGKRIRAEDTQDQPGHRAGPRQVRIDRLPPGPVTVEIAYRDGAVRPVPEVAATLEVVRQAGPGPSAQRHAVVLRKPGDVWKATLARKAAPTTVSPASR